MIKIELISRVALLSVVALEIPSVESGSSDNLHIDTLDISRREMNSTTNARGSS